MQQKIDAKDIDVENTVEELLSTVRPRYREVVRKYAIGLFVEVREGHFTNRNSLVERLAERIQGESWVCLTRKAQLVCLLSERSHAYFQSNLGTDWHEDIDWCAVAEEALKADICEELNVLGSPVHDPYKNFARWVMQAYDARVPPYVLLWCALHPQMIKGLEKLDHEETHSFYRDRLPVLDEKLRVSIPSTLLLHDALNLDPDIDPMLCDVTDLEDSGYESPKVYRAAWYDQTSQDRVVHTIFAHSLAKAAAKAGAMAGYVDLDGVPTYPDALEVTEVTDLPTSWQDVVLVSSEAV